MHEKLKMRVDLSCQDQAQKGTGKVKGTVDEFQPICSRMDHGTFYTIYLKLNHHEIFEDIAGKTKYRYNFDLFIQNFDGSISIGLDPDQKIVFNNENRKPADDLDEMEYDLSTSISVKPFSTYTLCEDLFCVLDEPLNNKILDIELNLLPPPSNLFNKKDLQGSEYIDPTSYGRDGEFYYALKAEPVNTDSSSEELDDIYGKDIVNILTEYDAGNGTDLIRILKKLREDGFGRPDNPKRCYPRRVKFLH